MTGSSACTLKVLASCPLSLLLLQSLATFKGTHCGLPVTIAWQERQLDSVF